MKLFEHNEQRNDKPSDHFDNIYDYYNSSNSNQLYRVRKMMNVWFDNYPETDKVELKRRFQKTFSSTFYELFIHQLFYQQGFELEPHPTIDGTSKRPDFLVKGHGIEFYLEVKESTDKSDAEKSLENRKKELYDQINKTNSPNFFLYIKELYLKTNNQPKGRKVIGYLENELSKYDPDEITQNLQDNNFEHYVTLNYEDVDLKLTISLMPKAPNYGEKEGTEPIGIYPITTIWGGSFRSIKKAIEKKSKYYGILNKPYLICINSTSDRTTDHHEVMSGLFGSQKFTFSTEPNKRDEKWTRVLDGVFLNSKGPKLTRVSAILITNVHLANLHIANHWLVKHPFAKQEMDFSKINTRKIIVDGNQIKIVSGKTITEILEIPDNWMDI